MRLFKSFAVGDIFSLPACYSEPCGSLSLFFFLDQKPAAVSLRARVLPTPLSEPAAISHLGLIPARVLFTARPTEGFKALQQATKASLII